MKFIKKTIALTLCMVLFLSLTNSASAYQFIGFKWNTTAIHYYYDNFVGSRAIQFFSQGATAWNAANVDATISYGGGNFVYCAVAQYPDVEWDGMVSTSWDPWFYVASQSLILNKSATSTWENDGALKSVVVHEFGHVYGLADNGITRTIMNGYTWGTNSRYGGYSLTAPQPDDINGVNAIY